jgi:predicted O-methyltransferase YrrM
MKPYMANDETAAFIEQLLGLHDKKKDTRIDVLEWGSGTSTLFFTGLLEMMGQDYEWISLEYDKGWCEKLAKMGLTDKTQVKLFPEQYRDLDELTDNVKHPMTEYIKYPSTLNRKFDLIFVDGRKRRRCLLEAKELLSPEGFVLLHDANREWYQCAMKEFKGGFLAGTLWKGKVSSSQS